MTGIVGDENIQDHMKDLHDVDLHHMLVEKVKLTEGEALLLASCRVGAEGLIFLK